MRGKQRSLCEYLKVPWESHPLWMRGHVGAEQEREDLTPFKAGEPGGAMALLCSLILSCATFTKSPS